MPKNSLRNWYKSAQPKKDLSSKGSAFILNKRFPNNSIRATEPQKHGVNSS